MNVAAQQQKRGCLPCRIPLVALPIVYIGQLNFRIGREFPNCFLLEALSAIEASGENLILCFNDPTATAVAA